MEPVRNAPRLLAHLNAAGAALPLPGATRTLTDHLALEADLGPHWAAAEAGPALEAARETASRLLGAASAAHVAFGETATRLWASALGALTLRPGDRILLARAEWGGNVLNALRRSRETGAVVDIVPSGADGRLNVAALDAMIDGRVRAICLPLVSSGFGTVQPVASVGALPRPDDCLLFVDAAQAVGRMPVSMADWRADVVTAPGRKWLRAPRGQAVMGLSARALDRLGAPPLMDQAGTPWSGDRDWTVRPEAARFEGYEFSVAGRLGLATAMEQALIELPRRVTSIRASLSHLRAGLVAQGVEAEEREGLDTAFLTFVLSGEQPAATVERLARTGIAIASVGLPYARLDLRARGLDAVCRVSPHHHTAAAEIDRFLDAVCPAGPRRTRQAG